MVGWQRNISPQDHLNINNPHHEKNLAISLTTIFFCKITIAKLYATWFEYNLMFGLIWSFAFFLYSENIDYLLYRKVALHFFLYV